MAEELFDVVCWEFSNGHSVSAKWITPGKNADDAEAIIKMAVMRQGVEDRFFAAEPAGMYKVGDNRRPNGKEE